MWVSIFLIFLVTWRSYIKWRNGNSFQECMESSARWMATVHHALPDCFPKCKEAIWQHFRTEILLISLTKYAPLMLYNTKFSRALNFRANWRICKIPWNLVRKFWVFFITWRTSIFKKFAKISCMRIACIQNSQKFHIAKFSCYTVLTILGTCM